MDYETKEIQSNAKIIVDLDETKNETTQSSSYSYECIEGAQESAYIIKTLRV